MNKIRLNYNDKILNKNFLIDTVPSFEKKRIAGKKNVNEFKDGFLILSYLFSSFLKKWKIYQ